MTRATRVVVLADRGTTSYLLINSLAARFDVVAVVFEAGHRRAMLRHRLRRLGVRAVLDQLAFRLWDAAVVRPRSARPIATLLVGHDVRSPDGRLPVQEVASVNDALAVAEIARARPDVLVLSGTGIVRRPLLEQGAPVINIHCGLTPAYRGVHGAFWAVHEGRAEEAGTTVHLVDAGVDTGAILSQVRIPVDPWHDTLRTLPVKQYLAALDAVGVAVEQVGSGRVETVQPVVTGSRQWYSPGVADHVRFRRRMREMRSASRDTTDG
jgi:phosphoribosylglycinamide formyltransferase-1